jgi:hypothetical protein
MTPQRIFWWLLASAGLMVIGAFGPWVKALGLSVSGTDAGNDGWLVVGAAVVGGGLFLLRRESKAAGIWAILGGAVGAATTIYDRSRVTDAIEDGGEFAAALVQVGWGLNVAMIASISFAVAGLVWFLKYDEAAVAPAARPAEPAP